MKQQVRFSVSERNHVDNCFLEFISVCFPEQERNPDMPKPPEGDDTKMREWSNAQRPAAPPTAYTNKETGARIIGAYAMNFKNGKEETTTRNGKPVNREQTLFALYNPETGETTPIEDTATALRMLMHSSKGQEGYKDKPFTIHVKKTVYSTKHRWFNGKGANPSNEFEVLQFWTTDDDADPYAEAIGLAHKARAPAQQVAAVKTEEEATPNTTEEGEAPAQPVEPVKEDDNKRKAEDEAPAEEAPATKGKAGKASGKASKKQKKADDDGDSE